MELMGTSNHTDTHFNIMVAEKNGFKSFGATLTAQKYNRMFLVGQEFQK